MRYTLTIRGRPVSQKNAKTIGRRNGVPFILSRKGVRQWKNEAVIQLRTQWEGEPLTTELTCGLIAYLDKGQRCDVDNLACAPLDAMQLAGVIANDYQINKLWVRRERDPSNPRIEITLTTRDQI